MTNEELSNCYRSTANSVSFILDTHRDEIKKLLKMMIESRNSMLNTGLISKINREDFRLFEDTMTRLIAWFLADLNNTPSPGRAEFLLNNSQTGKEILDTVRRLQALLDASPPSTAG